MDRSVAQLLAVLQTYGLADRDPQLAQYQMLAESGMLSPGMAKCILIDLQERVEKQKDFPTPLHRPPTREQLYADGRPDVEVGNLVESEQLRFGIRLRDRPRHILAAGATGSGKTTLLRALICGIEALNEQQEAAQSDSH